MTTENFKNKIQRLELENFTCFSKATFDFSSGINVFIGENGTGKTHVLKALYAMVMKNPEFDFIKFQMNEQQQQGAEIGLSTLKNFTGIFQTPELSRDDTKEFKCKVDFDINHHLYFKFSLIDNKLNFQFLPLPNKAKLPFELNPLFIPCFEMLSWFKGFIPAYEMRENSFDWTYYQLAKALSPLPYRHNAIPDREILHDPLVEETKIIVSQVQGEFYINIQEKDSKLFNAKRVATGINKLAQMIYLIKNGSLTKKTILFWDEPEVNLNPKYIKIVAKFLQTLAKNGVQIFVATHDYLLVHLLSLDAEYQQVTEAPPMRFFALTKGENGTEVESADTIAGITNNVLLDEYSAYSELEHQLFKKSMQPV